VFSPALSAGPLLRSWDGRVVDQVALMTMALGTKLQPSVHFYAYNLPGPMQDLWQEAASLTVSVAWHPAPEL
jgi:hypothetical protein